MPTFSSFIYRFSVRFCFDFSDIFSYCIHFFMENWRRSFESFENNMEGFNNVMIMKKDEKNEHINV